jgi:hypothetical protein
MSQQHRALFSCALALWASTIPLACDGNDTCARPNGPCVAPQPTAGSAGAETIDASTSADGETPAAGADSAGGSSFDLLNPVWRYSVGLTNPQILDRSGALVDNPLFAARDGKPARSAS